MIRASISMSRNEEKFVKSTAKERSYSVAAYLRLLIREEIKRVQAEQGGK